MISASILEEAFDRLDKHGYCVIKGVLTPEKCAAVRAGIHAYLKECGIDYGDATLQPNHIPHVAAGIMQCLAVGQCQAVWDVREDERVAQVFEALHGDNDLIVSSDGVCVQPTSLRDTCVPVHTDQSHTRRGRLCIQSLVNLTPALDEGTGTLEVIPGSHKRHEAFGAANAERIEKKDWFQYTKEDYAFLGGDAVRVFADAGDMVLWDSRTAHRGAPPPKELRAGVVPRERNVVYVCMGKRSLVPAKNIDKLVKNYRDRRMTSHWPDGRKTFPAKVNNFRKPHLRATRIPLDDKRTHSARQFELAGITPLRTRARVLKTPGLTFDYVDAKKK